MTFRTELLLVAATIVVTLTVIHCSPYKTAGADGGPYARSIPGGNGHCYAIFNDRNEVVGGNCLSPDNH